MEKTMKFLRSLTVGIILPLGVVLAGCSITPAKFENVENTSQLKIGKTTMAQAKALLGEPHSSTVTNVKGKEYVVWLYMATHYDKKAGAVGFLTNMASSVMPAGSAMLATVVAGDAIQNSVKSDQNKTLTLSFQDGILVAINK